jgi:DNA invertase Pin-like site-specific DNA recombinase
MLMMTKNHRFRSAGPIPTELTIRPLAEFERDLIRARTREGRERAVANGVRLRQQPTFIQHPQREAIKRRDVGKETLDEIARSYNVSRWTISRLAP